MNTMTETTPNPREVIGGNNPPLAKQISDQENFAQTVTDFLNDQFVAVPGTVTGLLDEARALAPITNDTTRAPYPGLIKRIRDEAKRLDAFHEKEKTPYLRGAQAVDQFFFGMIDKLSRRAKTNRPGAADVLNDRLTIWDNKVLEERRAEQRRLAEIAEREAAAARKKAADELAAAEEKRLAADRARKPEHIETKMEVADQQEVVASVAAAEAAAAADRAQAAHIDTLTKAPDIMRSRGDDGTLSTMQTEPYALMTDRTKLDYTKLAPFFTVAEVEKALRGWAKNTGYTVQMEGAEIGRRAKSVVR